MEPGAEVRGLVSPIMRRAEAMTPLPSHTMATTGPEVMNSTSPLKKGRSACSA